MISQDIFSIHDAAKKGDMEAVKYYITHGTDVNELNQGISALMSALMNNNIDIAKYLLDNGATILNETFEGEVITLDEYVKALGYKDIDDYIKFLSDPIN